MKLHKATLIELLKLTGVKGFVVPSTNPPDIFFPAQKIAIVLYDCELHQCSRCIREGKIQELQDINSTTELYQTIRRQIKRDTKYEHLTVELNRQTLMRIYMCQMVDKPIRVLNDIRSLVGLTTLSGEEVATIMHIRRRNA